VLLDYELAFSCALAALAILRIIHLRRKSRRVAEQLHAINNPADEPKKSAYAHHAGPRNPRDQGNEIDGLFYDRLIVLLLVLAMLWFGGRIWMGV